MILIAGAIGQRGEVYSINGMIAGEWFCDTAPVAAVGRFPECDVNVGRAAITAISRRCDGAKKLALADCLS